MKLELLYYSGILGTGVGILCAQGWRVVLKSFDGGYLVRMCARACTDEGIGHDVFDVMPVKDYNKITGVSRRFF